VKHQAFFFCEDEEAMHNDVLLCDVLFFDTELQLLGLGLRNEKCLMGKRLRPKKKSKKKKKQRLKGAATGIRFVTPIVFLFVLF